VNEDLKIAFFTTEIDIDKTLYYKIATMTIQWALHHHYKLIISSAGAPTYKEREWTPGGDEIGLYAVSSTESGLSIIRKHEFSLLKSGTISWIPAILLKETRLLNFEVIVFIVKIIEEIPDFRAAAILSNANTKVGP
jgi:predicted ATP-grasp superfamily ATP-dependent carboligase